MSFKKEDLNIEQLIELAKKKIPLAKDLPDSYTDVNKFILLNQLVSSTVNLVPAYIIYENYISWCDINGKEPRHSKSFFIEFSTFFQKVKKNGFIHYLITGNGMDVNIYSSAEKQHMKQVYTKRNLSNANTKKTKKTD